MGQGDRQIRVGHESCPSSGDGSPTARARHRPEWCRTGGLAIAVLIGATALTACQETSTTVMDIVTFAGIGGSSGNTGGPATSALLDGPSGLVIDGNSNLVFADAANNEVRVVAYATGTYYSQSMTAGDVYTIAGNGISGSTGDSGPAVDAELSDPTDVALDHSGNVVIADYGNQRIQVVAVATGTFYDQSMTAGDIYTVVGSGSGTTSPYSVTVDGNGNVIFGGSGYLKVLAASTGTFYGKAMTAGDVYTIAGNGTSGYSGTEPAISAEVGLVTSVKVDGSGNLVFADSTSNRVRIVAAITGTDFGVEMTAGDIYTLAGNGTAAETGNGGPGSSAEVDDPKGVAVDDAGNLLVADAGGNVIRVVAETTYSSTSSTPDSYYGFAMTAGDIYTIAGTGGGGFSGNGGLALAAQLDAPSGVAVYPAGTDAEEAGGDVFVSDTGNHVIRELTATADPTVTGVSPAASPTTSGGTVVTITGTALSGTTAVDFGSTPATSVVNVSSTEITATSPAGSGTVPILVTAADGISADVYASQFTYGPPTVTGVTPNSGPTGGGTSVTITGTGFTGVTAVDFGSTGAASFTATSATQITATTPAGTAGPVNVTVTTAGGSATDDSSFIYMTSVSSAAAVPLGFYPGSSANGCASSGCGALQADASATGTTPTIGSDFLPGGYSSTGAITAGAAWSAMDGGAPNDSLAWLLGAGGWNNSNYPKVQLSLGVPIIPTYCNIPAAIPPATLPQTCPSGDTTSALTLADGADQKGYALNYASDFQTLAQTLVSYGDGNAILRLGWEFTMCGDFAWTVCTTADASNFESYFENIVNTMMSVTGAKFQFVWNVGEDGNTLTPAQIAATYPAGNDQYGKPYVSSIGVDAYDLDPSWGSNSYSDWNNLLTYSGIPSLDWAASLAAANDVQVSIPEWGLSQDDSYYVNELSNWIATNNVAFTSYFDVDLPPDFILSSANLGSSLTAFEQDFDQ